MALFNRQQLAAIVESTPGTFNTAAYAAAQAQHQIIDASVVYDFPVYERNIKRGTLTPLPPLAGRRNGRLSFQLELAGNALATASKTTVTFDATTHRIADSGNGWVTAGFYVGQTVIVGGSSAALNNGLKHLTAVAAGYLETLEPLTTDASAGETITVTALPTWNTFLRGAGYRDNAIYKITIGAVTSGPFRHGETITQTTSAATAKVFFDTYTGTTTLYVYDVTGTIDNTNVWTGGTTGATATPSTVQTLAGTGWFPVDFPSVMMTYSGSDPAVGEVLTGGTSGAVGLIEVVDATNNTVQVRVYNALMYSSGETLTASTTGSIGTASFIGQFDNPTLSLATYEDGLRKPLAGGRGNVSFAGRNGEPVLMSFEFTGSYPADPNDVTDSPNLLNVTFPTQTPPVMLGASALLGTEGSTPTYAPRFTAFTLDTGHEVNYRESASVASGVIEADITARSGSGTLDPEADLEAAYPFFANLSGQEVSNLKLDVGSTAGNKFRIQVPGARFTGITTGNRTNFATNEVAFAITGGARANVSDSPGERNDILIAYLTA